MLKVVITDESMGVSQILKARAQAAPQAYAYDQKKLQSPNHLLHSQA